VARIVDHKLVKHVKERGHQKKSISHEVAKICDKEGGEDEFEQRLIDQYFK
jgi:hypothetical protein